MYTQRDQQVIDYLNQFKVATTRTLIQLFFRNSYRYGVKRLAELVERGDLKRQRCLGENYDYVYWVGKRTKQMVHSLYLSEFHAELTKVAKVKKIIPEFTMGNLRADGLVFYQVGAMKYVAFIEVQMANWALDVGKYLELLHSDEWRKVFPVFPLVIAITDQNLPRVTDYRLVQIRTDLDLSSLFSQIDPVVQLSRLTHQG